MENSDAPIENPARRGWRRWIVLIGFILALVWLNGPGVRWLGPKVAQHFFSKAGLHGSFVLEGNFVGGLSMKNLHLEGEKSLALVTIDRLTPEYRLSHLLRGKIDGISVDGLHADVRLGVKKPEEEKKPVDLEAVARKMRTALEQINKLNIDLENLSLNLSRNEAPVLSLAPTDIRHAAGKPDILLDIGVITDASGCKWPARQSSVIWSGDALMIDRLDPMPGIGVRNLTLNLPETASPSLETEAHIDDAVFFVDVSPGFSAVQINLREGSLSANSVAAHFGMELPFSGRLSSFSASMDGWFPDPMAATGSAQLLVEELNFDDWKASQLSLDVSLAPELATLAMRASGLGTQFTLDAESSVIRRGGNLMLGEASGKLHVEDVPEVILALAAQISAVDPDARVPASVIDGDFLATFANNLPQAAEANLIVQPEDVAVASPLLVKTRWERNAPISTRLEVEGMTADAEYDFSKSIYQGSVTWEDFQSARIDPWLNILKSGTNGALSINGNWRGGGEIKQIRHHGSLDLTSFDFRGGKSSPIHARGLVEYNWPDGFSTTGLQMSAANQSVTVDLLLAEGFLNMSNLQWLNGDKEMASGFAKMPMPNDFSKWRGLLASNEQPIEVSIKSSQISLASLRDWFPSAAKIDPLTTGQIDLKVSGTYAKPVVDAELHVKELRSPHQPKLPPADVTVKLAASDNLIAFDGSIMTPDLPPAAMTASMPFRPAEWARNPELIANEKISARLDLPRIDLARFTALIPGAEKFSGTLTGYLEAAGEMGKPELRGKIDLTKGALQMKRPDIPPLSGLAASVDFSKDKITLRGLKATVAGGTIAAGGTMALENRQPGTLDFRMKGDHLPLKRDGSLIVRANADLRLSGPWKQASLTGTAGVVDSIFYRDIEILPIGSPFTGPAAAKLPKIDPPSKPAESMPLPFRDWTLDIGVKTETPFLIRGNFATGKAVGKIRIGGTLGDPQPDGEVHVSDVRASLPFSTLEVRRGILRFIPGNGFDPDLEIRGTADPRPYRVGIFVYGKASDPQLLLTSSPPLPENEIMTLLATGTTTSGLEDPQMASSRALQLFIEELRRGRFGVGRQLRPLLKLLDRVDFSVAESDPYSSESYSTATMRITDRWFLSAGMSGEGDSRILAIWRLRFY